MEKNIFAIGIVMVILVFLPLASAQAFQTKDLQNSSASIKAHLVSDGTSFMKTKDFTIKDTVFSINNTKLEGYTFEPSSSYMTDNDYTGSGTMKIENSKDPNVSNITIAHVDFNFDFINVLKANGMTKYRL